MKYFLISLGVVLLIIFGIVIFNRGGSKTVTTGDRKVIKLTDFVTKTDASVRYSTDGAINALEKHRSIEITVSPTTRTATIYTGYQGQVLKTQTLPNDTSAYGDFIAALVRSGFVKERKIDASISSQAICPTGTRSFYKIVDGSEDVMNSWSASCTAGTFAGNSALTASLFQAQIPDYNTFTQGLSFSTTSSSSGGIF